MPSCPRCGAENAAGKAACWSCFAPLSARPEQFREAAAAASASAAEAAPAGRSRVKLVAVVVIVLVLAAAAYVLFLSKPGPVGVAKQYLEAVKAGDPSRQDQYLSERAKTSRSSGVFVLRMLGTAGIAPSAVVPDTVASGTDTTKTVRASLTFAAPPAAQIARMPLLWRERIRNGGTVSVQVILVREGGAWKVDDVSLGQGAGVPPSAPAVPPSPPGDREHPAPRGR
jgi:hypothetical protein